MRVVPFVQNRTRGEIDHRDMFSLEYRGSIGRGTGFGKLRFSKANFGDTRRIAGTYQRRRTSNRRDRYHPTDNPEYPVIAMRSYRPTYTNTELQAENRAKLAAAVAYWQNLTDEEKSIYNERGSKRQMSGYNVAVSDFMRYYDEAP